MPNVAEKIIMKPTQYARKLESKIMYEKGKSFITSYILLKRQNGHPLVCIHLLCQGIEIIMKSLLLIHDYDKYKNSKNKKIGHNITKSINHVISAYQLKPIKPLLTKELDILTHYYNNNLLRYGSQHDIFIDVSTIEYENVLKKVLAIMRLADKKFIKDC